MIAIENHCCGCAVPGYPCEGDLCPNRNVEVHYCDECGAEIDAAFDDEFRVDGKDLCPECRGENDDEED